MSEFEVTARVPLAIAVVWDAHEDLGLLQRIYPPYPAVRLLDPPDRCQVGTRFTIRLELLGALGLDWQVEIVQWEPPTCFVDQQRSGPFQFWQHTHRFIALSAQETRLVDTVEFEFNPLLDDTVIRSSLQLMFDWKMQNLKRILLEQHLSDSSG